MYLLKATGRIAHVGLFIEGIDEPVVVHLSLQIKNWTNELL